MKFLAPLILIGALLASQIVRAQETAVPFQDISASDTWAAVQLLYDHGAVDGNASFFPKRIVNRAEFMKIAALANGQGEFEPENCFPDVRSTHWYSRYVCALKAKRLINGYPDGFFHPEYRMNYAEALKILLPLFGQGVCGNSGGSQWYSDCLLIARKRGFDIAVSPSHFLNRGEVARLLVRFIQASSSSSSSPASSSSSLSSSSSSIRSTSSSSVSLDPLIDKTIRSQFLLLGETGPVIGAVSLFMNDEALDTTKITVHLTADVDTTVESMLLYDEQRIYLGRATLNSSSSPTSSYSLSFLPGSLSIPRRTPFKLYTRPVLFGKSQGGQSDQTVRISSFSIEGNGVWSSRKYTQNSTETFLPFLTARSVITKVTNAAEANAGLITGNNLRLGSFRFEGRTADPLAKIDVTELIFQIEQTGSVSLSDVKLGADGTNERINCTISASLVTCSLIPDTYGSLRDAPRTITLYGNVSAGDPAHASLRLTLNETGSISAPGSVTWHDGSSSFRWVPIDSPVASGTRYSY